MLEVVIDLAPAAAGAKAANDSPWPTPLPFDPDSMFWLDSLLRGGASRSTIGCYERDIRHVSAALGTNDAAALTRLNQSVLECITKFWTANGAAESTIFRRFSSLRSFARFLMLERSYDCSTLLSSRFPPSGRNRREAISGEAIETILSSSTCDWDHSWTRLRDCAVVQLAASSGLTTAELTALNRRHYDARLAKVRVCGSHLHSRLGIVSREAARWLTRYLDEVPFDLSPGGPLFVTTRRTRLSARSLQASFRRLRQTAGVSRHAVPSSLRNAVAEKFVRSGATPEVLAKALGIEVSSAWRYFDARDRDMERL
ncbi:phage integrase [Nitrobacter hamburgensis X14]|uniref:Phage integrase n=2 Tax=Nitrobacter hamburgensis TaxID=912 RepID=Q1QM72_NITHX|nr:phage integrase [Nitrobacter hamburgensis X14]